MSGIIPIVAQQFAEAIGRAEEACRLFAAKLTAMLATRRLPRTMRDVVRGLMTKCVRHTSG